MISYHPPTHSTTDQGGPECVSVSFNSQGQCAKLTVGVLMDPELGSTGGACRVVVAVCVNTFINYIK